MIWPEAEIAVHRAVKGAYEQAGADQQDQTERRFSDDQCRMQAMLMTGRGVAVEAALQERCWIRLRGAPRGHCAEEQGRDGSEREGEEQDETADGGLIHARDI